MSESLPADAGIMRLRSAHSVAATIERLEASLKAHGVMVFARIDFSGDAARAGLTMRPQQLLIFGNPKAGTPLMMAVPAVGLDLPLKALVWEDASGAVTVAYNDPAYVLRRHGVPDTLLANLAVASTLIEAAARP
jgi:uncharacterized protein (DUF302 family)